MPDRHISTKKRFVTKLPFNIHDENHLLRASLILVVSCLFIINAIYVANHLMAKYPKSLTVLTTAQTATTPGLNASVSKVSESTKPDPAFALEDGETLLVMNLSITNNTSEQQDFIPSTQLFVRTRPGDYRTPHPSVYVHDQITSGKINPHQTFHGQISFGVPKHATSPLLYIDTGWNNQVPVVFDVLR